MKSNLTLLALTCALVALTAQAQNHFGYNSLLTLTPADARSSGAGGVGDEGIAPTALSGALPI